MNTAVIELGFALIAAHFGGLLGAGIALVVCGYINLLVTLRAKKKADDPKAALTASLLTAINIEVERRRAANVVPKSTPPQKTMRQNGERGH